MTTTRLPPSPSAEVFRPGAIVDRRGNTLGAHGGVAGFTVGQKRGLGLATGRPLYVIDLDPDRNTVSVARPRTSNAAGSSRPP